MLISVEGPNLTTPITSDPTGILKYDLSNQKASNQYLFKIENWILSFNKIKVLILLSKMFNLYLWLILPE